MLTFSGSSAGHRYSGPNAISEEKLPVHIDGIERFIDRVEKVALDQADGAAEAGKVLCRQIERQGREVDAGIASDAGPFERAGACTGISASNVENSEGPRHLFDKHRIIVTSIGVGIGPAPADGGPAPLVGPNAWKGIRVTPSVYTTLDEVALFADVVEKALKNGIPA